MVYAMHRSLRDKACHHGSSHSSSHSELLALFSSLFDSGAGDDAIWAALLLVSLFFSAMSKIKEGVTDYVKADSPRSKEQSGCSKPRGTYCLSWT